MWSTTVECVTVMPVLELGPSAGANIHERDIINVVCALKIHMPLFLCELYFGEVSTRVDA